MKFYTQGDSYYEVRTVHSNLHRIFYCHKPRYGSDKISERLVSSQDKFKKATKAAQHFRDAYNIGFSDGSYGQW
ncbi:hypothetical protein [Bacillus toyonensis]|uniref:hypothetical protein n=1 Tax=Bacillus toyonensis TaxID=155322 RepID=UPI002E22E6CA|nr:hypothetical protein [Bacillus toyonensis]